MADKTTSGDTGVRDPEVRVAAPEARNSVLDWLLVRQELRRAHANAAQFSAGQREHLRRAQLALELGELALEPGNAVRSGSTAPLAANLFRQAIYWALLAQRARAEPVSPERLWAEADPKLLQSLADNEGELASLASAIRSTFIELADGKEEEQRANALQLRRAARRLLVTTQDVLWRLERAKLKRFMRFFLLLVGPALAIVLLWPSKVDLARGMRWRTSSIGIECHPEKSDCGGVATNILFHTKVENDPWFEYDFGTPLTFSSLTIQNRSDYGPERAVPLVVEVSNDDKSFTEIARRTESFSKWSPRFAAQHARYLRLRVARESILHLESIKVHP